jgi:hypothetical protein
VVFKEFGGERPLPRPGGGEREAALLIEVAVDGMFTIVYGQQTDRVVLERVIEDLQYLVARLDEVYPKEQPRGRCLEFGSWGRCRRRDKHGENHDFPTQRDFELIEDILAGQERPAVLRPGTPPEGT